jgi:DNA replication protein DnaC
VILEILYKQSNIPIRYQYPENIIVTPADKVIYEVYKDICKDILSWVTTGKSLFLWSEIRGNGKTSLACMIGNRFIREMVHSSNFDPVVYFITSSRFLEDMRQQYSKPDDKFQYVLNLVETVPLLILDDIGAEKPSEWVKERLLNIIDERYSNCRSTIYTSNCNLEKLLIQLDARIYDRIRDAKSLEFKSKSWRGSING